MAFTLFLTTNFGRGRAGLSTVGYTLYNAANVVSQARTTTGVLSLGGGIYGALLTFASAFAGHVVWDTGDAFPVYDMAVINPPSATTSYVVGTLLSATAPALTDVGYQKKDRTGAAVGSRITTGVQNWGNGWYGAVVTFTAGFAGSVKWDSPSLAPFSVVQIDLTPPTSSVAYFGAAKAGLATVGFTLYDETNTLYAARSTTGVINLGGGTYGAAVTFPAGFQGRVQWDTGESSPDYYNQVFNPEGGDFYLLGADFGAVLTSLTTEGYTLYNRDGTALLPRVATGFQNWGGGWYGAVALLPSWLTGAVVWDTGLTDPWYAVQALNVPGTLYAASNVLVSHWGSQFLTFEKFGGGLVVDVDPREIRKDQSPDCYNVDLEDEAIRKRFGKVAYNTPPTGTSAEPVRGVTKYYGSTGTTGLVMAAGTKVYADLNNDGDFDDANDTILSGLTGGVPMDLFQYRNNLYAGNSVDGLYKWAGVAGTPGAIIAPLQTPVVTTDFSVTPILTLAVNAETNWDASQAGGKLTTAVSSAGDPFVVGSTSIKVSTVDNQSRGKAISFLRGVALDMSRHVGIVFWLYCATTDALLQVQVGVSEGGVAVPPTDWSDFPVVTLTQTAQWQRMFSDLSGVTSTARDAVLTVWLRVVDWGGATPPFDFFIDGFYAEGQFEPDTYRFYCTYAEEDGGITATQQGQVLRESAPGGPFEVTVSGDVAADYFSVGFSANAPVVAAGGTHVYLYRTREHAPYDRPLRSVRTSLIIVSGPYTDNTTDGQLVLDFASGQTRECRTFGLTTPPKAKTYAIVRNRVFAGAVTVAGSSSVYYPKRIFITYLGQPEAFVRAEDPKNEAISGGWLDLPTQDEIVRIVDFDGMAVVFCNRSVWTIEGTGFDNYVVRKRADAGLTARWAVAIWDRLIFYLAPDGMRALAPNADFPETISSWVVSEPVGSLLQAIPTTYLPNAAMGVDERGRIHLSFTAPGGTLNTAALVFDPREQGALTSRFTPARPGWTAYTNWGYTCFTTLRRGAGDHGDLIGGDPVAGRLWRLHQNSSGVALETDAGSPILWAWTSRAEALNPGSFFRPVWVNGSFDPAAGEMVYLEAILDRGAQDLVTGGNLANSTLGAQPLHARFPGCQARSVQARVSGVQSVELRCHALTLGVDAPR